MAEAFDPPLGWEAIADQIGIDPALDEAQVLANGPDRGRTGHLRRDLAQVRSRENATRRAPYGPRTMPWEAMTLDALAELEGVCLTGAATKAPFRRQGPSIGNKAIRDEIGADVMEAFAELSERVEAARLCALAF
jgi:hypothetical protein